MKQFTASEKILRTLMFVLLGGITFVMIYPFYYVIIYAFSSSDATISSNIVFWPIKPTVAAFLRLFKMKTIWTSYCNSILVTGVGTVLAVILSILIAYPLSLHRTKGRNVISMMLFFTMLFSGGMIPNYLLIKELGLLNSTWSLILPGMGSAYNILILRNFFQAIPAELEESASMDGASQLRVLVQIILPVSLAGLAVQAMFYGVGYWNAYFDCVLYIDDVNKLTLQAYLRTLMNTSSLSATAGAADSVSNSVLSEETMRMAAITAAVIPVLIVYPFLQKYYVKGVIVGSVKG